MVARYARPHAWRQLRVPWQEALRIRPEERYLEYRLDHYKLDRLIDEKTAPGSTIFTIAPIPEAYTSRKIRVEYQSAANQIAARILWSAVSPEAAPTGRLRFAFPRQALRGLRVVQTRQGGDTWSIHEFRIWDGGRELPRAPGWRLTARPTAWGVQDAFDNSLATFWLCGEPLRPGQFVEVVFHSTETADSVVLETAPNQWGAAFGLEGQDAAGRWVPLSAAPTPTSAPRPLGLRRAVAEELKRRGIDYLLVFNTDNGATDLRLNLDLWGMRLAGEEQGARLYQLP
jgi:hypothetical protein